MDLLLFLFDFIIHIDEHLRIIIAQYGALTYGLLFLIVFCETGLVVTPFLPGDSLLFVAGTIAAAGGMAIAVVMATLAGVGRRPYLRSLGFCVLGALAGVGSLSLAGYWFGNQPVVKNNLTAVILL